jgi:hypothetical protein
VLLSDPQARRPAGPQAKGEECDAPDR